MKKKYDILQPFKGSPDGHTVIQYTKGQTDIELNDELGEVALAEKWAKLSKADEKAAKAKAKAEAEAQAEAEAAAQREAAVEANANATIFAQIEAKQAELDALLA
jgi:hypothetical protein